MFVPSGVRLICLFKCQKAHHYPFFFGSHRMTSATACVVYWRNPSDDDDEEGSRLDVLCNCCCLVNGTGKSVHRPLKRHRRPHRPTKRPIDRINCGNRHSPLHNRRRRHGKKKERKTHAPRVRMYSPQNQRIAYVVHYIWQTCRRSDNDGRGNSQNIIQSSSSSSVVAVHPFLVLVVVAAVVVVIVVADVPAPNSHILITEPKLTSPVVFLCSLTWFHFDYSIYIFPDQTVPATICRARNFRGVAHQRAHQMSFIVRIFLIQTINMQTQCAAQHIEADAAPAPNEIYRQIIIIYKFGWHYVRWGAAPTRENRVYILNKLYAGNWRRVVGQGVVCAWAPRIRMRREAQRNEVKWKLVCAVWQRECERKSANVPARHRRKCSPTTTMPCMAKLI